MAKALPLPAISNDPNHKRTFWETIIITTPVVLTVVATVLAGLSSSESSSAQYSRSAAAEMQSKASDQWGYFQAKKLRADQSDNTLQVLQSLAQPVPFDPASLNRAAGRLADEIPSLSVGNSAGHLQKIKSSLAELSAAATRPDAADDMARYTGAVMPVIQEQTIDDPQIQEALHDVDSHVSESDLEQKADQIPQDNLDRAMVTANNNATAFSDAVNQANKTRGELAKLSQGISQAIAAFESAAPADAGLAAFRDSAAPLLSSFTVANLSWNSKRYQQEANYNQVLGQLYEIQVRKEGFTSDRHRLRSKQFFYGMLGAQAGVTIATFSLAVRRRNLLWGLAASAGLAAVTFAAYVYVFV